MRNLWIQRANTKLVNLSDWQACQQQIDFDALKGQACYAGIAETISTASIALLFPDDQDNYKVCSLHWEAIRPDVINIDQLKKSLRTSASLFDVKAVGLDAFSYLGSDLKQEGFNVFDIRQGYCLSSTVKKFQELVANQKLQYAKDAVLYQSALNAAISADHLGSIKINKANVAISALINALALI